MVGYTPLFLPFQPSHLRFLSGPTSPASPLFPSASNVQLPKMPAIRTSSVSSAASSTDTTIFDLPPMEPMPWIWCCHVCNSHFPLGATRRCLYDGHVFCAGSTVIKRTRRPRKHRACTSEFDYLGWENWGTWRRSIFKQQHSMVVGGKDCVRNCNFPSECRWAAKRAVEVLGLENPDTQRETSTTPTEPAVPASPPVDTIAEPIAMAPVPMTSFPVAVSSRRSSLSLETLIKAVEQRSPKTIQVLSPIEEEQLQQQSSSSLDDQGLILPVLDFTNFKATLDTLHNLSPTSPEPMLTSTVKFLEDINYVHYDMIDVENEIYIPQTSPGILSLDFGLQQVEDELSPISPRRNAWDWTAGSIGLALSTPTTPNLASENVWGNEMDEV